MTLIGLVVLLILAAVIMWAAHSYLPYPFSLITIGLVILILVIVLLNMTGMIGSMNRPILGPG